MKRTELFGTIVSRKGFPNKPLRDILDILEIKNAFVFKLEKNDQFLITFGLDKNKIRLKLDLLKQKYRSTFPLHRKRGSNVFFTINSLNYLEKEKNQSLKDFSNCIILCNKDSGVEITKTQLIKIVNL